MNQSSVYASETLLVEANITRQTLALDRFWFTYNGSIGNASGAQEGSNTVLWTCPTISGNYSVNAYANDTSGTLAQSATHWV